MRKSIKSLFFDKHGLALVEFALTAPLILILFFSTIEFTRYIIMLQKVERSVYSMSNIAGQFVPITYNDKPSEIDLDAINNQIFPQFKRNMEPYVADEDRTVIITSMSRISNANNNASLKINWQAAGGGTFSNSDTVSIINGFNASSVNSASENGAAAGTIPTFPSFSNPVLMDGDLAAMAKDENMIIVEVFYRYRPIASDILSRFGATSLAQATFKAVSYSRPRHGDLLTLVRPNPPIPNPTVANVLSRTEPYPDYCSAPISNALTCKTTIYCYTNCKKYFYRTCTTTYTSATDLGTTTCGAEWYWGVSGCTNIPGSPFITDTPSCVIPPTPPPAGGGVVVMPPPPIG